MNLQQESMFAPPPASPSPLKERLVGIGVALACGLLLCCLLSYSAEQVSWRLLNPAGHEKAGELPCTNLLGVVGMYVAGLLYYLLGVGAVYGALLAPVPAMGLVIWPHRQRRAQWVALGVMLITACAIFSVQPWLLVQWAERQGLASPGGLLGQLLGARAFEALLGKYWALSLLLLAHAGALIYFARLTPKIIYHMEKKDLAEVWQRWLERRRIAREEKEAAARAWERPFDYEAATAAAQQRELPLPLHEELPPEPDLLPAARPPMRAPMPLRRPPQPEPEELPERRMPPRPLREDEATPPARPPLQPQRREPAAAPAPAPRREPEPRTAAAHAENFLDLLPQRDKDLEQLTREPKARQAAPMSRKEELIRHFDGTAEQEEEEEAPAPRRAIQPPAAAPAPRREPQPRPAAPPTPAWEAEARDEGSGYPLPPYDMLRYEPVPKEVREAAQEEMAQTQEIIIDTLDSFRISVQPGDITRGPSITRYEFSVPRGQTVQAVAKRKSDLMATTRSTSVNILAPIPGKSTVGVELENSVKEAVYLRELLQSPEFHNPKLRIPVALGKNVYGNPVIGDLAAMPHVIVAGTTGSGKSVCINSMLLSMLYKFKPDELRLILVDPKQVEMVPYKKLPHLAVPVVTDPARVIGALRWAVNEMERRYTYFSKTGVRNLEDFNRRDPNALPIPDDDVVYDERPAGRINLRAADAIVRDVEESQGRDLPDEDEEEQGQLDFGTDGPIPDKLPYIVIVVDELADLMAQVKEDLELYISRLTAKARAAGIHMIVATQTPRAQVVTGTIKTNLPCRIALKVASALDSRVILDEAGAENLMGRGDLLFLPPGGPSKMERAQGAFVSDEEIQGIVRFCAAHAKQNFMQGATAEINADAPSPSAGRGGMREPGGPGSDADEELYNRCLNLVVTERKASTTLLQRRFSIGYGKAARIMEMLEERGVVSPATNSSRAREVLIEDLS